MTEPWVPPLYVSQRAGRCRLMLSGVTHGEGGTLQEAADDLVTRLLELVMRVRSSGLGFSTDIPPPDHRLLDFIWELGERAARGEDIRERVFGPIASLDK